MALVMRHSGLVGPAPPLSQPPPVAGLPAGAVTAMADVMALDATNTGYTGTLTASSGFGTTAANQVFQNLRITGRVQIYHPGAILRNCEIIGRPGTPVDPYCVLADYRDVPPDGGVTLENCTIHGADNAVGGIIKLLYRCNMYNVSNGPNPSAPGGGRFVNCYIHDLSNAAGSHDDGIENNGASGVEILYNKIVVPWPDASGGTNAAIMQTSYFDPITSGLIKGNYLEGGGYTVYVTDNPPRICRTTVQDNTIKKGFHGYFYITGPDVTLINNTLI